MRRLVFALLLTPAFAHAQGQVKVGSCSVGATAWAPSTEEDCRAKGGTFYDVAPGQHTLIITVPSSSVTSTISAVQPKCPAGYTLVHAGHPMCARDLVDPAY